MAPAIFQPLDKQKIYDITLKSTQAKEKIVYIYEQWDLSDFIWWDDSEKMRDLFLKNNITVHQLSNTYDIESFSENQAFVDNVMKFRYITKEVYQIDYEILIFDDVVAIYNKKEMMIIESEKYANNQKQLFSLVWEQWISPRLWFSYNPNHSLYNSLDFFYDEKQIIIWPDRDAKQAYNHTEKESLGECLLSIIKSDKEYYQDASYMIWFIRSYNGEKMIDMWKFTHNNVDDRSWPLSEVRVYREWVISHDLWLASGNTLLVLGYEEKLRRQSGKLTTYLSWPAPQLPLEVCNNIDYF